MSYRKYNVVNDWYRYGKTQSSYYKGKCGVKFYGGVYGNRKGWSKKYANLSYQVKDFLAHGAFNIVNPQWKTIQNYFFFKQAAAFPSARRVYLFEARKLADLIRNPEEKRPQTENNQFSSFENFLISLSLGRSDTFFYVYAKAEGKLFRIVVDEEKLKKLYGKRRLKKIILSRGNLSRKGANSPLLPRLHDYSESPMNIIEEKRTIANTSQAVTEVHHALEQGGDGLPRQYSTNPLKMYLDPSIHAACLPVLKWYVKNNDPRSNVSALKEPFGVEATRKPPLSVFLYISQDKISDGLKLVLRKRMGFCGVNGIKEASGISERVEPPANFHFSAIQNMQESIDQLSHAA